MEIETVWMSREDIAPYVARYAEMRGSDKGLPDSEIPGNYKFLYSVIGFRGFGTDGDTVSPVGADLTAAISANTGFSLGYTKCPPGNGPLMHVHDTWETFVVLTGTWRFIWEPREEVEEYFDLGALDVFAVPPGVPRRFTNLTPGEGETYGMLMAVTGGDAPTAGFSDKIRDIIDAHAAKSIAGEA